MAVVSPPTPPPKLSLASVSKVGQTKEVLAKMAGSRFTSQNKKL